MTSHDSTGKDKDKPSVVTLRTFDNELDAELAKSALTAAGIYCVLSHDPLWRMDPFLSSTPGVNLTVRAEDAPRANEILDGEAPHSK
jgi:Putative prokaryotic signal transducing protein